MPFWLPSQQLRAALAIAALFTAAPPVARADEASAQPTFCASCHGAAGLPHDPTVPVIWGQQAGYVAKQLRDYRGGERENQIMSSVAEGLTDAQITALAAYFAAQPWPEIAHQGASVAGLAACQGCHQAGFTGGAVAGFGEVPRLAGQQPAYLRQTMQEYASGQRGNSSVMPALMRSLKPADRAALAEALGAIGGH